jgi:hypothetical protein
MVVEKERRKKTVKPSFQKQQRHAVRLKVVHCPLSCHHLVVVYVAYADVHVELLLLMLMPTAAAAGPA